MCERTTCYICLEEKFSKPCGANNDCRIHICDDCKIDNDYINNNSNGLMDNNLFICPICKEKEYKEAVYFRLLDIQENTWGVVENPNKATEVMMENADRYN